MNKKVKAIALAFIAGVASHSVAYASTYIEVSGANIDFYYKSSVWGAFDSSVNGNTISFFGDIASANVRPYNDGYAFLAGEASIVAVAHHGFAINKITPTTTGSYASPGASFIQIANQVEVFKGSFNGLSFAKVNHVGTANDILDEQVFSAQTSTHFSYIDSRSLTVDGLPLVLGLDTLNHIMYDGGGYGAVTSAGFQFEVTPVPEPAMFSLLLPGMLLLFGWRRRSKMRGAQAPAR